MPFSSRYEIDEKRRKVDIFMTPRRRDRTGSRSYKPAGTSGGSLMTSRLRGLDRPRTPTLNHRLTRHFYTSITRCTNQIPSYRLETQLGAGLKCRNDLPRAGALTEWNVLVELAGVRACLGDDALRVQNARCFSGSPCVLWWFKRVLFYVL